MEGTAILQDLLRRTKRWAPSDRVKRPWGNRQHAIGYGVGVERTARTEGGGGEEGALYLVVRHLIHASTKLQPACSAAALVGKRMAVLPASCTRLPESSAIRT